MTVFKSITKLILYFSCYLVDSAGEAFADQLDSRHKVTCPWRGNCCADSLVQFPPTPLSALIGGYKDRCDGLLQFPALPVTASSAVEEMRLSRGTQIDRFLLQPNSISSGELSYKVDHMTAAEFPHDDGSDVYYHVGCLDLTWSFVVR